jgi:xylan 1,4-beta-xylosidase
MRLISLQLLFFLSVLTSNGQASKQFTNPILAGFYPDPSVCKVGSDYYLVNSTFSYYPGIPVFHSKDLVHWNLISHVMDRPEQMDLTGLGVSRGIFAPDIAFHDGTFYVMCTLVDRGGNFVVTAKDPHGPWSNPVFTPEIKGIDPSLFFDDNGEAYVIYNSDAPDNKPLYDGHRTIKMYGVDIKNLKVKGEPRILVNGGSDISKKPIWIEGPHIYKKDGYYYLMAAEGGTGDNHSEVIFRSKQVEGPYVPFERNPILTQRHLDKNRKNPITSTGHADLVEGANGEWWAVFLGCRPYAPVDQDYYNTGRETFLAPVQWNDGWPIINPGKNEIQYRYPMPFKDSREKSEIPLSGNFVYRDNFDSDQLKSNWVFLRTVKETWYDLTKRKGSLAMQVRPSTCLEKTNPSFVAHRQQHQVGSASTSLDFSPRNENEKAGMVVFQNENHFYFLCKSVKENAAVIELYKSAGAGMELLASQPLTSSKAVKLKIESNGNAYSFLFADDSGKWEVVRENVDAKFLSTRVAGGFVGAMYALYATSQGQPSETISYFDWFEYSGNDDVFK